jgi:hypothetical protein
VIERLRTFAAGPPPDQDEAAGTLRLVYVIVFGGQVLVALAVGTLLAWWLPAPGATNDVLALVLLMMAVVQLPIGWALGRAAIRAGGRAAAMSGVIASAVVLSVPAWFGVLLLVSGQRPLYLAGITAVVSVGYSLGFLMTGTAARLASTEAPDPASEAPSVAGAAPDPAPRATTVPGQDTGPPEERAP